MDIYEKAIDILKMTHDGDDLIPQHLKLVENAVNVYLNENGMRLYDALYENVKIGKYERPPYLGVKYMDRDQEGYVYFKGKHVEHYSSFYAYSASAKADLKVLQSQCIFLEETNRLVNNFLQCEWKYKGKYAEEFCRYQKEKLDKSTEGCRVNFTVVKSYCDYFVLPGHLSKNDIDNSDLYREELSWGKYQDSEPKIYYCTYGNGNLREPSDDEIVYIDSCFEYFKDKKYININEFTEQNLSGGTEIKLT